MNCPFKQTFRILLKSVILLAEKELTAACHTTATFFFSFFFFFTDHLDVIQKTFSLRGS